MQEYQIGPLRLHAQRVPGHYRAFAAADHRRAEVTLTCSDTLPPADEEGWVAEHELMNVRRSGEEWRFEDARCRAVLTVRADYSAACFCCAAAPETPEYDRLLAPLLQSLLQCAMVQHGYAVLHAACVSVAGEAVAFSGPSGSGKSTRALRLVEHLGGAWISGDRPVIDPENRLAYGAPWDGKEQVFSAVSVPLRCIAEVRRANTTCARRMTPRQASAFLAGQLFIPMWDTHLAAKALSAMQRLIRYIPILRLYSDRDLGAAMETYNILFRFPGQIREMEEEKVMKLKEGFEIVVVSGDYLALPTGDNIASFSGSVVLNEVSAALLKELGRRECTKEDLLAMLLNEYEVEQETARRDLDNILKTFGEIGLID